MDLFLFLIQVFLISLSGVLAPGPVMTATIAAGAKSRHAGFLIAIGHCLLELPLLATIMLGAGFIFEYQVAKISIGLAGGLFLLWLSYGMFRELKNYHEAKNTKPTQGPILTGILLSAGNPYFLLWWATVGLNIAKDAVSFGYVAFLLFALVHSLCDIAWLEALSLASFKGTRLLNQNGQKNVLAFCAIAIAFFGLLFITRSLLSL